MDAALKSPSEARLKVVGLLKEFIERVYGDGVDQIAQWRKNADQSFTGAFVDRQKGAFQFSLNNEGLSYFLLPKDAAPRRLDSHVGFLVESSGLDVFTAEMGERFDAKSGRKELKKCQSGTSISCGYSCIHNKFICHVGRGQVIRPQEMLTLRSLADQALGQAADGTPVEAPAAPKPKGLEEMTIRELRVEAQGRGVPGYSHVNKGTLLAMINSYDAEPPEQRRISKAIATKEKQLAENPLRGFIEFWGVARKLGVKKGQEITGATLLTVGLGVWKLSSERYTGGFSESANAATAGAAAIQTANIGQKPAVTFVVNRGRTASDQESMSDGLKRADPDFLGKHHIVALEMDGIPVPAGQKNRAGLGDVVENYAAVAGTLASTMSFGKHPQAVELAAQILAYGDKYSDSDGKLTKGINLVGDREGGIVVSEAIEILKVANKKLAEQVRAVSVGTPDFGLRPDKAGDVPHTTISSKNDPLFITGKRNPRIINDVKGGKAEDYLKSPAAVDAIGGALGKYDRAPRKVIPTWQNRPKKGDEYDPRNDISYGVGDDGQLEWKKSMTIAKQELGYSTLRTQAEKDAFLRYHRLQITNIGKANIKRAAETKAQAVLDLAKAAGEAAKAGAGVVEAVVPNVADIPDGGDAPPPPKKGGKRRDAAYWKGYRAAAARVK